MMEMVIDGDWSVHANHIVGILEHGVAYLKIILPECAPSRDVIRATSGNTKHFTLVYNEREAFKFTRITKSDEEVSELYFIMCIAMVYVIACCCSPTVSWKYCIIN
jgi:hypothetical protein